MAKTAKAKRSPKRAPAKRDRIGNLMDIRPAKRATRSPEQKKELEPVFRTFARGMDGFGEWWDDHRQVPASFLEWLDERAEELGQIKPAVPRIKPSVWFRDVLKAHPRQPHEGATDYANRIYPLMLSAPLTNFWKKGALRRRLYD